MYIGREFAVANPPVSLLDGFDFINDLDINDTVYAATSRMTVHSGIDPTPNNRLFGSPLVLPNVQGNNTVVVQRVAQLLPGVCYVLQIVATTILGDTLSDYSRIQCRDIY